MSTVAVAVNIYARMISVTDPVYTSQKLRICVELFTIKGTNPP